MERLMTRNEAAAALGLKANTLAKWSCLKTCGPAFLKLGGSVRYRQSDLEAWLTEQTVKPST
jgi:predicted DNA-binding transcriptional regulator AlpA